MLLIKHGLRNIIALSTLAVVLLFGTPSQAVALQTKQVSGASLVLSQEALQGSYTVTTQVRILSDADGGLQGVWLAGLAASPDQPPGALALSWSKVSDGWFGPTWSIQLASNSSLLVESPALKDGNGFLSGYKYQRLYAAEPEWGHEYEVALGYTPKTGAVSIALTDLTTKHVVFQQSSRIESYHGALYPVAGYSQTSAIGSVESPAQFASLDALNVNLPRGIEWWLAQQESAGDTVSYVDVIDRQKRTSVVMQWPWQKLNGELRFTLSGKDAFQKELLRIAQPENMKPYAINISGVPPGGYRLNMDYVEDGRIWNIDQQTVTVGRVSLQLADVRLAQDTSGKPVIKGQLLASSDGPVNDLVAGVKLELKRHVFQLDNVPGMGTVNVVPVRTSPVFSEKVLSTSGTEEHIPFETTVTLPATDDKSVWQATLQAFAIPDNLLDRITSESIWIGRQNSALSWAGFLQNEKQVRIPVAPGVDAYRISGRIAAGPIEMFMLEVKLDQPGVSVDSLAGSHSTSGSAVRWPRSQVSKMVAAAGAVAGVNASFFEIDSTMVPRGMLVHAGEVLRSPGPQQRGVLGIASDGKAYIGEWLWRGEMNKQGSYSVRIDGVNSPSIASDAAGLYRAPRLSSPGKSGAETLGAKNVVEAVIADVKQMAPGVLQGRIVEVRQNLPGIKLTPSQYVVTAKNQAADSLVVNYQQGDVVEIAYEVKGTTAYPGVPATAELLGAASGGVVLVKNGLYGDNEVYTDTSRHPRTAVAVSADRRTLYFLVVDGRSTASVGMTYREMADLFLHMGAFEALNLDGGGSSTLAIRSLESGRISAINTPSDGAERYVADGVGIFYALPTQ